ncbi:uncharacterized protein LOC117645137 [Thrips palmi]|uniref:Uncharacterized protein LOC117645137 n=1 Tax=Thrips palmi TaxID=161013 RepID=A0A6P8YV26_THRPL|nr:uncharacterized protein LOC117645137 [Thrips palmi]XP_034240997.1 uncharacterized protein LOC117645137 [Thrips palmi]
MVIYLPLLFAEGRPTSLEKITINQLEKFIPFMLSCCPDVSNGPPLWWLSAVPYNAPLTKVPGITPQRWLSLLKQLVCRCYEFHKCEHLLRFCARLCQLPPDRLHFKETTGGFISIINKANNKLIVTFKKRNKIYDQKSYQATSPFKSLLPVKWNNQPPREQPIEDIYLCNYCDCEFTSGKDAIAHEVVCEGKGEEDTRNEALDQTAVMRYFGLAPSRASPKKLSSATKRGTSVKLTGRSYMQIPFSSPLGIKMGANVAKLSNEMKVEYSNKIELNCCMKNTSSNNANQTRRPRRIMAAPRSRKFKNEFWSHTYCFNKAQKREQLMTLKTGLNKRARHLLKKCKRVAVLVERLPLLDPLAIHAAASLSHQYPISTNNDIKEDEAKAICIDLTDSDDENLKENCGVSSSDVFLNSSNHKRPPLHEWSMTPTSIRQSSESVSAPISSFTSLTTSSLLPIPSL